MEAKCDYCFRIRTKDLPFLECRLRYYDKGWKWTKVKYRLCPKCKKQLHGQFKYV